MVCLWFLLFELLFYYTDPRFAFFIMRASFWYKVARYKVFLDFEGGGARANANAKFFCVKPYRSHQAHGRFTDRFEARSSQTMFVLCFPTFVWVTGSSFQTPSKSNCLAVCEQSWNETFYLNSFGSVTIFFHLSTGFTLQKSVRKNCLFFEILWF